MSRTPAPSERAGAVPVTGVAHPVRWAIVLLTMGCTCVAQAFGRFTYSLLITDVRDDLDLSNTVAGSVGSANLGAYLLGTLAVSLLVGRLGLSRTTRLGLVGVTLGLLLLSWGPSLPVVFAGMAVAGFSGAAVWITTPALATAELGPSRRGTAIGLVGMGIGAGIVFASVLEATVAADTWRTVYRIEVVVAAIVAAVALVVFRGGPPAGARRTSLSAIRRVPRWGRLLASYGFFAVGMSLFVTFMVAVLEEDAGWSTSATAATFITFGVGSIFGGPVFGPLSDRFGRSRVLVAAFTVMAVTALVLPLGAGLLSVIAAFCFGMAFAGVPTIITARVSDAVDAESFGAAFGVATLAFGVGLTLGPQLGGLLRDVTGSFRPAFVVVAACAVAGAAFGWEPPRREDGSASS